MLFVDCFAAVFCAGKTNIIFYINLQSITNQEKNQFYEITSISLFQTQKFDAVATLKCF